MTTDEKLEWLRQHWRQYRAKGRLLELVQRIIDADEFLKENYSAQDIIDIEESMPNYLR